MALVPEFNPGGNPSPASTAVFEGINMGQSLMDRAQARQLRAAQDARAEAEAKRAQEDYDITLPARRAKAMADATSALNSVAGAAQMGDLMASANKEFPSLRQQWIKTYEIKDPDLRLEAQDQLLGNASRFSSLKGIGEEINQWHEILTQGHLEKRGRDMISGRAAIAENTAGIRAESAKEIADLRAEIDREKMKAKEGAAQSDGTMSLDEALAQASDRETTNPGMKFVPKPVGTGKGYVLEPKPAGEEMTTAERTRQQRIATSSADMIRKAKVALQMLEKYPDATGVTGLAKGALGKVGAYQGENATRDVLRSLKEAYAQHLKSFSQGGLGQSSAYVKDVVDSHTPEVGLGIEFSSRGVDKLRGLIASALMEGTGAAERVGKKSVFTLSLPEIIALKDAGAISEEAARGLVAWKDPSPEEIRAAYAMKKGKNGR